MVIFVFKLHAMNAIEKSPKQQIKRIRLISRTLKTLLVIYVLTSGVIALMVRSNGAPRMVFERKFATYSAVPATLKIMTAIAVGIYLLAVVFCYQLLRLYERGEVFSLANVRIYRRLGLLAVGYGLMAAYVPTMRPELPVTNRLIILFFETASSNWIIGGVFLVMISLIMGEACRAHEEQELTV
jgi:Protein of unknown function (DUF2975)